MNIKGGLHLTTTHRNMIQDGLDRNLSCKEIAQSIDKDERTI